MHFQLAAARAAFAALLLAVLTGLVAAGGVRLGLLSDKAGTNLMIPAVVLGVAALVAALVWLRSALARNSGEGKKLGLIALLGAGAFLFPPLSYVYYGFAALPIHDATTDPGDPPQFAALAKVPSGNSRVFDGRRRIPYSGPDARYRGQEVTVAYAFHDKYPQLTHQHAGLLVSPQKTFWRCFEAVKKLGWTLVEADEKSLRIEATDKSFWFGRISDIVIRIRPAGTIGSRVDVRSESREGELDHGRNVARLKAFFRAFHF
jgi:fatty-acyl-CoA synthase